MRFLLFVFTTCVMIAMARTTTPRTRTTALKGRTSRAEWPKQVSARARSLARQLPSTSTHFTRERPLSKLETSLNGVAWWRKKHETKPGQVFGGYVVVAVFFFRFLVREYFPYW